MSDNDIVHMSKTLPTYLAMFVRPTLVMDFPHQNFVWTFRTMLRILLGASLLWMTSQEHVAQSAFSSIYLRDTQAFTTVASEIFLLINASFLNHMSKMPAQGCKEFEMDPLSDVPPRLNVYEPPQICDPPMGPQATGREDPAANGSSQEIHALEEGRWRSNARGVHYTSEPIPEHLSQHLLPPPKPSFAAERYHANQQASHETSAPTAGHPAPTRKAPRSYHQLDYMEPLREADDTRPAFPPPPRPRSTASNTSHHSAFSTHRTTSRGPTASPLLHPPTLLGPDDGRDSSIPRTASREPSRGPSAPTGSPAFLTGPDDFRHRDEAPHRGPPAPAGSPAFLIGPDDFRHRDEAPQITSREPSRGPVVIPAFPQAPEDVRHIEEVVSDIPQEKTTLLPAQFPHSIEDTSGGGPDAVSGATFQLQAPWDFKEDRDQYAIGAFAYDGDDSGTPTVDGRTPSTGRMSDAVRKRVEEGFHQLDTAFVDVAEQAGVTVAQLQALYDHSKKRQNKHRNAWDMYQSYFADNLEQECRRLSTSEDATVPLDSTMATKSRCYHAFKASYRDTYMDILDLHHELRLYSLPGQTVGSRSRTFRKSFRKLKLMATSMATLYGFQTAMVMTGNSVNEDGGLGDAFTTEHAVEFFEHRCRASADEMIAHLKAHVYNNISNEMVDAAFTGGPEGLAEEPVKALDVAAAVEDMDDEKALVYIKTSLLRMLEKAGMNISPLQRTFPWKRLPGLLADGGMVCHNWPEDVRYPGQDSEANNKGISILVSRERRSLADSFQNHEHPLRIEMKLSEKSAMKKGNHPVIFGVPPTGRSRYTKGLRVYANGRCDHGGQPKVVRSETPSEHSEVDDIVQAVEEGLEDEEYISGVTSDQETSGDDVSDASDDEEEAQTPSPKKPRSRHDAGGRRSKSLKKSHRASKQLPPPKTTSQKPAQKDNVTVRHVTKVKKAVIAKEMVPRTPEEDSGRSSDVVLLETEDIDAKKAKTLAKGKSKALPEDISVVASLSNPYQPPAGTASHGMKTSHGRRPVPAWGKRVKGDSDDEDDLPWAKRARVQLPSMQITDAAKANQSTVGPPAMTPPTTAGPPTAPPTHVGAYNAEPMMRPRIPEVRLNPTEGLATPTAFFSAPAQNHGGDAALSLSMGRIPTQEELLRFFLLHSGSGLSQQPDAYRMSDAADVHYAPHGITHQRLQSMSGPEQHPSHRQPVQYHNPNVPMSYDTSTINERQMQMGGPSGLQPGRDSHGGYHGRAD